MRQHTSARGGLARLSSLAGAAWCSLLTVMLLGAQAEATDLNADGVVWTRPSCSHRGANASPLAHPISTATESSTGPT